jgi:rhodanese-related sulfurtransferase
MAVQEIHAEELMKQRNSGVNAVLVDVREEHEYIAGHIPGAINIPLSQIVDRVSEMKGHATMYIVCQLGGRSMRACEFVESHGIVAINIAGGTTAWGDLGGALVTGEQPE